MTTENYPTSLPVPLVSRYSNKELEHFRKNNVQSGAIRYELLTNVTPAFFSVSFNFSSFDLQTFEGWYKESISLGVKSFNIFLNVGMGNVLHECYFDASYNVSEIGKRFSVTATFVAIEKQYNNSQDILDLIQLHSITDDKNKEAFLLSLLVFAEETLPDALSDLNYGTDFS